MNSFAGYYTRNLYPLQDGVLRIVQGLALPFYLTGGTALSRHYFAHRYSDDLDLGKLGRAELIKRVRASLKFNGFSQIPQLEAPSTEKNKKILE